MLFDVNGEQALVLTEVHAQYCALFEGVLLDVLDMSGVDPAALEGLVKAAQAEGADEADVLLDFAAAVRRRLVVGP